MESILKRTMEEMPKTFTSREFNSKAIINGYPKRILGRKGLSNFIKKYAKNEYYGSKTWTKFKRISDYPSVINSSKVIELPKEEKISQAIKLLKLNGYKIYKTIEI